jgi:hypothetical protein
LGLAGRTELCRTTIPELYRNVRDKQEQELQEFSNASNDPFIGALATDGWKKKACSQGTPLISCNITKPNGGAYFRKVCNARHMLHSTPEHVAVAAPAATTALTSSSQLQPLSRRS